MKKPKEISRKTAAKVIEEIQHFCALLEAGQVIQDSKQPQLDIGNRLRTILSGHGLEPDRECTGDAHDPRVAGQIDHCGVCMPNWGWVSVPVKII